MQEARRSASRRHSNCKARNGTISSVRAVCPNTCRDGPGPLFDDKDFDRVFTDAIPLKRWAEAEDVANLGTFLASDEFELFPR
jgi:NAD(P)-dependent dehydrogenase (short-subunit alcohol dehydrogenase family)